MIQGTLPQLDQIKFQEKVGQKQYSQERTPLQLKRARFDVPDMAELTKPKEQFASNLYDFAAAVKEDTQSNNAYFTTPNPILQSYRELPPDTSIAYGPVASMGLASQASQKSLKSVKSVRI